LYCRRGRKRRAELEAEAEAGLQDSASPVQWVRVDPGWEWLCDVSLQQPERMWLNQLEQGRDVVAQVEAVRALAELPYRPARPSSLRALRRTLEDVEELGGRKRRPLNLFCRLRMEAAAGLARQRDEAGHVGLAALLEFYKQRYWDLEADVPKPVCVVDPGESLVAAAVVAAVSRCRSADGSSDADALLFLLPCLEGYHTVGVGGGVGGRGYDDREMLAALCRAMGEIRCGSEVCIYRLRGRAHC
jgi:transcription initiation factor TFIID subunit 2